jgi:hypothetical protein
MRAIVQLSLFLERRFLHFLSRPPPLTGNQHPAVCSTMQPRPTVCSTTSPSSSTPACAAELMAYVLVMNSGGSCACSDRSRRGWRVRAVAAQTGLSTVPCLTVITKQDRHQAAGRVNSPKGCGPREFPSLQAARALVRLRTRPGRMGASALGRPMHLIIITRQHPLGGRAGVARRVISDVQQVGMDPVNPVALHGLINEKQRRRGDGRESGVGEGREVVSRADAWPLKRRHRQPHGRAAGRVTARLASTWCSSTLRICDMAGSVVAAPAVATPVPPSQSDTPGAYNLLALSCTCQA